MSITLDDALDVLNVPADSEDLAEIALYVDVVNTWMASRIADTSPSPVTLATLFLLEHLWQSQRGPGSGSPLDGAESVIVGSVGYAIPNRVLELIDPYRTKASPTYSFPDAVAYPDPAQW